MNYLLLQAQSYRQIAEEVINALPIPDSADKT